MEWLRGINKTLQEMARTMLNESGLSMYFRAEAVNTTCYVVNMAHIRSILKRTSYELWKGRLPNISYFHAFGCKCFVHNNGMETLGKFDAKSDEGIFLGYSSISKTHKVFNKRLEKVEESIHVIFDETNQLFARVVDDDDVGVESKFENLNLNGKDDEKIEPSKELPKE